MRSKIGDSVILLVLFNYFVNVTCFARPEGSDCIIDTKPGVCRKISDCSSAWNNLVCHAKRSRDENVCNNSKRELVVCCPRSDPPVVATSCLTSRLNLAPVEIVDAKYAVAKSKEMCGKYSTSNLQLRGIAEDEHQDVSQLLDRVARSSNSLPADDEQEGYGPRISNGTRAHKTEFPHMAAIGFNESDTEIKWACGGSLISEQYVLTAAHCLGNRRSLARWVQLGNLELGINDLTNRYTVTERIAHPDYQPPALYNDLALLRLDRPVPLSRLVHPACLQTDRVDPGLTCTATGWGVTDWANPAMSNDLLKVLVRVQLATACNVTFNSIITSGRKLLDGIRDASTICAGDPDGGDTCQGDSGGPIQVKLNHTESTYVVIGVTSYGMTACGTGHPALYSRVSYFLPWIVSHVWPQETNTSPKTTSTSRVIIFV